ncbi:hypothetical protein V496_02519 [Pseudogymnoascus sp. VKM F-4515 (FW-2607)]|nr:hypothetical protein V496_02519 [Pseudogymnoascus sp. VKM F-4515 (FW-2607)]
MCLCSKLRGANSSQYQDGQELLGTVREVLTLVYEIVKSKELQTQLPFTLRAKKSSNSESKSRTAKIFTYDPYEYNTTALLREHWEDWDKNPSLFWVQLQGHQAYKFDNPQYVVLVACLQLGKSDAHSRILHRYYTIVLYRLRKGQSENDDAQTIAEVLHNLLHPNQSGTEKTLKALTESITSLIQAGSRYDNIARNLGIGSLFVLGEEIARSTWEKWLPKDGDLFNNAMQYLTEMGVVETGKTYEKLAEKVIAHLDMLINRSGVVVCAEDRATETAESPQGANDTWNMRTDFVSESNLSNQPVEAPDPMQPLLDAVAPDQDTLNICVQSPVVNPAAKTPESISQTARRCTYAPSYILNSVSAEHEQRTSTQDASNRQVRGNADSQSPSRVGEHVAATAESDDNLQGQTNSSHSDQIPQALDRTQDLPDESYIPAPLNNESFLAQLQVPEQAFTHGRIEEPRKRGFDEYQPPNKRRKAPIAFGTSDFQHNGLDESAFGRLPSLSTHSLIVEEVAARAEPENQRLPSPEPNIECRRSTEQECYFPDPSRHSSREQAESSNLSLPLSQSLHREQDHADYEKHLADAYTQSFPLHWGQDHTDYEQYLADAYTQSFPLHWGRDHSDDEQYLADAYTQSLPLHWGQDHMVDAYTGAFSMTEPQRREQVVTHGYEDVPPTSLSYVHGAEMVEVSAVSS